MIHNYFETHHGGLDLIAGRLTRELLRQGEDVRLLASDVTPPPIDPELASRTVAVRVFNVTERRLGIPYPIPTPRTIWRIAREVQGSEAVLLQDSLYPMCVLAFIFARLYGKPVIIAQHVGIVPYRNPLPRLIMALLNRIVARPMLAHADRLVFFSEITARYFAGLKRPTPAKLMFTGVDTTVFRPADTQGKADLRRSLGLSCDSPVVLFVGRFVEKKGLHVLERMARRRPDIQWAFAGWGHLDPEQWKLDNVVVFRGRIATEIAPLYQASDVFVLPSKGEGFPLVIQEALACGLPVVCSAENADADAAVRPHLFPVALDESDRDGTAAAFCAEIDRRLTDQINETQSAQTRFQFVATRYSWSSCGAEYRALIQSAVREGNPVGDAWSVGT